MSLDAGRAAAGVAASHEVTPGTVRLGSAVILGANGHMSGFGVGLRMLRRGVEQVPRVPACCAACDWCAVQSGWEAGRAPRPFTCPSHLHAFASVCSNLSSCTVYRPCMCVALRAPQLVSVSPDRVLSSSPSHADCAKYFFSLSPQSWCCPCAWCAGAHGRHQRCRGSCTRAVDACTGEHKENCAE